MKITIFTPAHNRASLLAVLYESLCAQTYLDFEWLIVDDGSTDDTRSIVESFAVEQRIVIRYFHQPNGGKHRAVNRGIREAKGELFFIVDSDDCLVPDALERIRVHYGQIARDPSFAGVCGVKANFDGVSVSRGFEKTVLDCTSFDFRYKFGVVGDMAEVFKTSVLKEFPFPEFYGEKFCPEALVWNRIAQRYKLRYFNEKIYLCEYLPDGLTAKIVKLRMQSPEASKLCYAELYHSPVPFRTRLKAAINYWRFACCSAASFSNNLMKIGWQSLPAVPFGFMLHLRDCLKKH